MDFGIGHPEKIVDWAHRAVHEMTLIAKAVVESADGRAPLRSYFTGCSTGGQQALSEAQRYPADYDGIVAGAPGNNRINLVYGFLWSWLATHDASGKATLPAAKLPALARAAVAACDKQDGLEDGVIDDPRACRFDPAALACTAAETDSCLTAPQIEAVAKVYAGARARDGQQFYPGWARGSESGWGQYITNPGVPVRIALFRDWVFENPKWDPRTFDWDKDVATVDAAWPMLNAISTDYTAFNARGGKSDHVHGPRRPGRLAARHDRVLRARRQRERRPRRDTAFLSLLPRSRHGALWRRQRHEHVRRSRSARGMGGARHRAGQHPRISLSQRARRSHAAAVRISGRRPLQGIRKHR